MQHHRKHINLQIDHDQQEWAVFCYVRIEYIFLAAIVNADGK